MDHRGRSLSIAVLALSVLVPALARAESAAATLSVLAGPVERVPAGTSVAEASVDGMDLAEGDRIKTGPSGLALITFLNGTTITVLSGSDVVVKQAGPDRAASGIRLLIHAGRVWARVVQAAGRRSSVTLESNEYAATAHDGLIGAERGADGFVCWARRGELRLTDRSRQVDTVVRAGRRARVHFGSPVTAEPFVPSASMLEVRTSGPVVPLVRMPDARVAAGFLARDVEVNHVFGSLSEERRGGRALLEVPGGHEGAYTIILTGTGAGPFTLSVTGRYAGFTVYRQEFKGEAQAGDRQFTRVTHDVAGQDPRTGRVIEASFERPRPWDESEPAAVVARPGAPRAGMN